MMLSLAAAVTLLLGADAAPRPKMLTPAEIIERLERSQTTFQITSTDSAPDVPAAKYADILWPRSGSVPEFAQVIAGPDGRHVVEATISPETVRLVREAEPLFRQERYDAAAAEYEKGLSRDPRSFLLLSHLGDCHYKRGRYEDALKLYERAIAALPTDHRLWWYKGQCLAHLGRRTEALNAFTEALVLRPRFPLLLEWLERNAAALRIRVDTKGFSPKAFVRNEGDLVQMAYSGHGPAWLAFAMCKALWLGDPPRRKEATGSDERAFTSFEERECLAALLSGYEASRSKKDFEPDSEVERVEKIVETGLVDGFILYEFGSRVSPTCTLVLGDEARAEVRRYVRAYVLVSPTPPE